MLVCFFPHFPLNVFITTVLSKIEFNYPNFIKPVKMSWAMQLVQKWNYFLESNPSFYRLLAVLNIEFCHRKLIISQGRHMSSWIIPFSIKSKIQVTKTTGCQIHTKETVLKSILLSDWPQLDFSTDFWLIQSSGKSLHTQLIIAN